MIRAWRREDGRYRLTFDGWEDERPVFARFLIGDGLAILEDASWTCRESAIDKLKAEKVYGVVTGPSSCGCEPAKFRWVAESEVKAGRTTVRPCRDCAERRFHPPDRLDYVAHQCDIIDVCGEADVAEAVYEAEFAGKIMA